MHILKFPAVYVIDCRKIELRAYEMKLYYRFVITLFHFRVIQLLLILFLKV